MPEAHYRYPVPAGHTLNEFLYFRVLHYQEKFLFIGQAGSIEWGGIGVGLYIFKIERLLSDLLCDTSSDRRGLGNEVGVAYPTFVVALL